MKLLGSTKFKINNDENGQNVPHLKITEAVLVHSNIFNNDYQHDTRVLYTVCSIAKYLTKKISFFKKNL